MNDWYLKNIAEKKGLNTAVKQKIDALTGDIKDPQQIINIIYNYVKNNFKYVAIEIGMGAFIPSHANEVYLNKQGDCKDLSNFLSEALNYKGIESTIALAATFDHISDCNFPSLNSANHVISIVYLDDKILLLDPTDPIHKTGTPVQSLQDRTIFIVNPDGGSFYDVKRFKPKQNTIDYYLDLKINTNNLIEGDFEIDYNGISSNYLRRILNIENKDKFKKFGETFFREIFGNQQLSNLSFNNNLKKLNFKGSISISGKIFSDDSNTYLFIDFLPRLIESETRETLIEGTYLGNTFLKKINAKIKLKEPIESFTPIEYHYKNEGVALDIIIKTKSNLEIECSYNFTLDHIFVDKGNVKSINDILKSYKKIINEPVVLKKQKD